MNLHRNGWRGISPRRRVLCLLPLAVLALPNGCYDLPDKLPDEVFVVPVEAAKQRLGGKVPRRSLSQNGGGIGMGVECMRRVEHFSPLVLLQLMPAMTVGLLFVSKIHDA